MSDSKQPKDKWGGYGAGFEDNPGVYSHDEVLESAHGEWEIVGRKDEPHRPYRTLTLDLDTSKADGFDMGRLGIASKPTGGPVTAITKTPSKGLHIPFVVQTGEIGSKSDFDVAQDVPFGIDIQGSFTKSHFVAPNDIPGVETDYELAHYNGLKSLSEK